MVTDRELRDRVELRELVDSYAQSADRRRPQAVAALFTAEGVLEIYHGAEAAEPISARQGREEIEQAIRGLSRYRSTTHFVGNHLVSVDGDRATGETYCLAHHVYAEGDVERVNVWSIRYDDTFARTEDGWRLAHRRLRRDWVSDRPLREEAARGETSREEAR